MAPEIPKQLGELTTEIAKTVESGKELSADLMDRTTKALNQAKEALKTATAKQMHDLEKQVSTMRFTLQEQMDTHPEIKQTLDSLQTEFHDRCMALLEGAANTPKTIWERVSDTFAKVADWVTKNPQILGFLSLLGLGPKPAQAPNQPTANPTAAPSAAPAATPAAAPAAPAAAPTPKP